MKQLVLIIFFLFCISSFVCSAPIYEKLWTQFLQDHSKVYIKSDIEYVHINYKDIALSQRFQSLRRVLTSLDLTRFSENEKKVLLLNQYNLYLIESVIFPNSNYEKELNQIKDQLLIKDKDLLFLLGTTDKTLFNLVAFQTEGIDEQISKQKLMTLKKLVTINRSNQYFYVHRWLKQHFPVVEEQKDLIRFVYPTIQLDKFSVHYIDMDPVLNDY